MRSPSGPSSATVGPELIREAAKEAVKIADLLVVCGFAFDPHDGDAFFVRHEYFTGADDPYDRLRRALRADISEEVWTTVNSTVSRAFPRPKSGKVAIKVINHYGDEVMKVFAV